MRSLYLAWQAPDTAPKSRAWFPVGRLDAPSVPDSNEPYRFRYIQGARKAHETVGFEPLMSFPEFDKDYTSEKLFPLFENRVMSHKRADFEEYVNWLGLTPEQADPISILSVSGGRRVTDNLHVFPKVEPDQSGLFRLRFFVHGLKYLTTDSKERAQNLQPGDQLQIMVEVNNPATGLAVILASDDYKMIGFAPRYLVADLIECIRDRPQLTAKVVKVNFGDAPLNQSLLVEYVGYQPRSHALLGGTDFTPLIGEA